MERAFLKKRALITGVFLLSFIFGFIGVSVFEHREVQAAGTVSVRVEENYNFPDGATVYFDLSGFSDGDAVTFTFTMPFEADSFSWWNMEVSGGPTVYQITITGWGNPNNNGSNVYGIYVGKTDACGDLFNGGAYVSGVTVSNPNATEPPPPPPPTTPPAPGPGPGPAPTTPTTPTTRSTTAATTAPTTAATTRQTAAATTAAPTTTTTTKPAGDDGSAPAVTTTVVPAAGGEETSPAQPDASVTTTDVTASDTSETSEESSEETSEETSESLDIPTSPSADAAGEVTEETSETHPPTPTPLPRLYDAGIHQRHFPWWILILGAAVLVIVLRYRKLASQDMYMDEIIYEFIPGRVIGNIVDKIRPPKQSGAAPVPEEEKPKVVNGYLQTSNTRVIRPEFSNVAAVNKAKELEKAAKNNGELPGIKPPVKRPKNASADHAASSAAGSAGKTVDLSKSDGQNSGVQDDIISSEEVNEQGDT
jgi:hypothetical protein